MILWELCLLRQAKNADLNILTVSNEYKEENKRDERKQ